MVDSRLPSKKFSIIENANQSDQLLDKIPSSTLLKLIFFDSNVFEVTLSKFAIKLAGAPGPGSKWLKKTDFWLFSPIISQL